MNIPSKNKGFELNQEVQLQQNTPQEIKSYYQESQDEKESNIVFQVQKPPKNDIFGFWCTAIFFSLIFVVICGFFLYQQSGLQPHGLNDDQLEQDDDQIFGQPYKEGDEVVETYDLIKRDSTSALCLDGSPGSYYLSRTGDPSRILFSFEGGGWCMGIDEQSTLRDCSQRSTSWLGGSSKHSETISHSGNILSKHPDNYFRNWKKVYLNYCDGSGHQGTRNEPVEIDGKKLYFRGHNITTQHFEDLEKKFGLFSKTKKVVVTGISAGGLAVFTWANYLGQRVKSGRVYAIPDAGIFLDGENINTKRHSYRQGLANLMKISNVQIDPPTPECIKENPYDKVKCMLAQHLLKHIKVPMFVVQSVYDSWSLPFILGIYRPNPSVCSDEEKRIMEENRVNVTNFIQEITKKRKNGAFGISCNLHGMVQMNSYMSPQYTIPSNSSFTLSKSIEQWLRYRKMSNTHLDLNPWPSNQGCA